MTPACCGGGPRFFPPPLCASYTYMFHISNIFFLSRLRAAASTEALTSVSETFAPTVRFLLFLIGLLSLIIGDLTRAAICNGSFSFEMLDDRAAFNRQFSGVGFDLFMTFLSFRQNRIGLNYT